MSHPPAPEPCDAYFSFGVTIAGRAILASESKGDPLGSFPSLLSEGRPYNLWLTEQVLDPVLVRWSRAPFDGPVRASAIVDDIERAHGRGRLAFREMLSAAAGVGDSAILATMGVTANLQRTLALLGECMLDDRPARLPRPPFLLSRFFCGLVDYPADAPYFPGRIHPPVHAARLRSRRMDVRHLGNALWCAEGEINRHCDEALEVLGREVRRKGCFQPGDLRHLHAHSFPGRLR